MQTWMLVIAIYTGGAFGPQTTLGPMPNLDLCLDVASAAERAGKGHVMAGCTFMPPPLTFIFPQSLTQQGGAIRQRGEGGGMGCSITLCPNGLAPSTACVC